MHTLIMRQGDLLTGVVNAIRGEPSEDCRHSHHDAPELAANVVAENARLLAALRDLLAVTPAKAPATDEIVGIEEKHKAAIAQARSHSREPANDHGS